MVQNLSESEDFRFYLNIYAGTDLQPVHEHFFLEALKRNQIFEPCLKLLTTKKLPKELFKFLGLLQKTIEENPKFVSTEAQIIGYYGVQSFSFGTS